MVPTALNQPGSTTASQTTSLPNSDTPLPPVPTLAEVKSGDVIHGVQQLGGDLLGGGHGRQLHEVHAGGAGWQSLLGGWVVLLPCPARKGYGSKGVVHALTCL